MTHACDVAGLSPQARVQDRRPGVVISADGLDPLAPCVSESVASPTTVDSTQCVQRNVPATESAHRAAHGEYVDNVVVIGVLPGDVSRQISAVVGVLRGWGVHGS